MSLLSPWNEPQPLRCLFVRNMVLDAHIGVFEHEQGVTQRIRVNVVFGVPDSATLDVGPDDLGRTVSYERVVLLVREIVARGHVALVETLAERIAAGVLEDRRIRITRVCVEKLDIFDDAESVGVEIERRNPRA
ncbi:dihydroneopterin aldolase [Komagataeibacter sp. FXV3]|uniref:dihydroneopterin aldolase n=1 Tax=Komagataeibacter sp. FXV3 TaxID=2608998 RepID=UPI00187B18C0|nr:dihydroneopterin aldolase [Komagataeibacter sp. FXV3]MBE7729702.1 dihydroneopterin aldolase [Komagataeibacter sp. FXV3]